MNQTPQEFHEQRLRAAIYQRTHSEPGSVNDRIPPYFVSCSSDGKTCTVRYVTKPEMRNPMGWLHGGVTSAMLDMGMGLLAYYNAGMILCPTSTMTINFLRPGRIGGAVHVESQITFLGHRIIHTRASAWMEDEPDKLIATCTGSYMVPAPKPESKPQVSTKADLDAVEKASPKLPLGPLEPPSK